MSVTPAIGASTVAGRTATAPSRTSAGTRASAGIACSTGLSQSFFTVNPRPAMVSATSLLALAFLRDFFRAELRDPFDQFHGHRLCERKLQRALHNFNIS